MQHADFWATAQEHAARFAWHEPGARAAMPRGVVVQYRCEPLLVAECGQVLAYAVTATAEDEAGERRALVGTRPEINTMLARFAPDGPQASPHKLMNVLQAAIWGVDRALRADMRLRGPAR